MNIDLGCGSNKVPGCLGVDTLELEGVDVDHDLNCFPYPFECNVADNIYLINALEHLENPWRVMQEVHRILKPGGVVHVRLPHYTGKSLFADPTHLHTTGVSTSYYSNYFTGKAYRYVLEYPKKYYFSEARNIRIDWCGDWVRLHYPFVGFFNPFFNFFGNLYIPFTERILGKYIGFEEHTFELVK